MIILYIVGYIGVLAGRRIDRQTDGLNEKQHAACVCVWLFDDVVHAPSDVRLPFTLITANTRRAQDVPFEGVGRVRRQRSRKTHDSININGQWPIKCVWYFMATIRMYSIWILFVRVCVFYCCVCTVVQLLLLYNLDSILKMAHTKKHSHPAFFAHIAFHSTTLHFSAATQRRTSQFWSEHRIHHTLFHSIDVFLQCDCNGYARA